jgi:tetratricopeptide (TPR) repeat protein
MTKIKQCLQKLFILAAIVCMPGLMPVKAQIDTDRMTIIGRNALYFEDYILAIQYFNQIIKSKPYLSEPYYFRAIGKYNLEDLKGAELDCSSSLKLNPYFVDAYNLRGIVRQRLGLTKEALTDFSKGLEIEPANINLITNIGICYINLKDYPKAIESYNKVLKMSPKLVSAYLNRGLAKVANTDTIGGLDDFTKAISINPYLPDGYINRAITRYQTGDFQKSLDDMDKAIELKPNDSRLYMNRGAVRYQLDNLRGTAEDFDKVIEMEPRNAMAYSNRGILRAQIGDTNRAIEDFSRVLALQTDDLLTLYYRGMLYAETGQWENAIADFNVVASNFPDFAPVFFNRSQARQKLGDSQGAALDYGTAMNIELSRRERSDVADSEQDLATLNKKRDDKDKKTSQKTGQRKATRKDSDKDIRNYNKIAVLDDFDTEKFEEITASNPLRGRIQDRNIIVEMEPVFGLTFFPGDTLVHRLRYFNLEIDKYNHKPITSEKIKLSNYENELPRETAAKAFSDIEKITKHLEKASDDEAVKLLMARALSYSAVLNLNNAMDDYNRIISMDPTNYLAWFNRAFTRFRMVEIVSMMKHEPTEQTQQLQIGAIGIKPSAQQEKDNRIIDYELILKDLDKVLELNPDFEFAHFNIGMVQCFLRDFDKGIIHFTKAIEINPEFAEAWFNRGLTRIYLEQEAEGTLDLSKAGELGIFKAYNVIKRYGSSEIESDDDEEADN